MLGVPKFEIGHVDVHDSVHPENALETVVSRGVINEWQPEPAPSRDCQRFQNLGHNVLRCDEIDVVAPDPLQIEHDLREFRRGHLGAFTELAGLEILAKDAPQIAPPKKDRARAVPAAQTIFLTEMWKGTGDAREPSAFAHTDLVVEPVDLTIARTNLARTQRLNRLNRALLKKAPLECSHVRRDEIFPR